MSRCVGVLGGGKFGLAVANLLARRVQVRLYVRSSSRFLREGILQEPGIDQAEWSHNISVTSSPEEVASTCSVIFPIVPSYAFREVIRKFSPFLGPSHILIHGTKGLDIGSEDPSAATPLPKELLRTMSQVIREETSVLRVGCMSGPNLSSEIASHQPAATVVASEFDEVIREGKDLLKNDRFLVYGAHDLVGTELCGALKNIVAIGTGILEGLSLGYNAKALLISRSLVDLISIGRLLGAYTRVFVGLAGIGDMIATSFSPNSRNFSVGKSLARGEKLKNIIASMKEVAEGVRTTELVVRLAKYYNIRCVIPEFLYRIFKGTLSVEEASTLLMKMPFQYEEDV
ncbi:MAG: NAD(P)H-dependent glycerol-3-phosphate dehydrogenase [Cytophagales bacterium]|nr:NAD(P)H-dependent glycerol-3-phosphate dehydrogenase [Cytophagales bacterium]